MLSNVLVSFVLQCYIFSCVSTKTINTIQEHISFLQRDEQHTWFRIGFGSGFTTRKENHKDYICFREKQRKRLEHLSIQTSKTIHIMTLPTRDNRRQPTLEPMFLNNVRGRRPRLDAEGGESTPDAMEHPLCVFRLAGGWPLKTKFLLMIHTFLCDDQRCCQEVS